MWKTIKRTWRYLAAALGAKVEEAADPKIQLEQAIEEAKRRHLVLTQQAATVIGQEHELDRKLGRKVDEIERLQDAARHALRLAETAGASGDATHERNYGQAAQAFALELVTAEQDARELKAMHETAVVAADQARKAVEHNAMSLQQQIAESSQLRAQLENAKMQERLNDAMSQMDAMAPKGDTPTLAQVREKIDRRYAKAIGAGELHASGVSATMLEVQHAALEAEAAARLDALRAQLDAGETAIEIGDPAR